MSNKNKAVQNSSLTFWINGEKKQIEHPDPSTMLAYYLRGIGLTGVRIGCGEGGCGSCTVMLSRYNKTAGTLEHRAVKSCLIPLCSIDGMAITTIEGLGSIRKKLDPVQYKIAACNGSQCGFCTPGFVMNMFTFIKTHDAPTALEIENLFDGNLCRCTGYRAILHGMKTFAPDYKPNNKSNKKETPQCCVDKAYAVKEKTHETVEDFKYLETYKSAPTAAFTGDGAQWLRPANLEEVYTLKQRYAAQVPFHRLMLVAGHTSTGVCNNNPGIFIDISRVKELNVISRETGNNGNQGIRTGSAVTIQALIDFLTAQLKNLPQGGSGEGLSALCHLARRIGSLQIRNTGSIGGNIFLAKLFEQFYPFTKEWHHNNKYHNFVSDLFTAFAVLGVTVTVGPPHGKGKNKKNAVYRMLEIPPLNDTPTQDQLPLDAVFIDFFIPYAQPGEYVRTYKVADRDQDGQAFVNAGFRVCFDGKKNVKDAVLIFGGIGYNSVSADETVKKLKGHPWNPGTLTASMTALEKELTGIAANQPIYGKNREYRIPLAVGLFYRFFMEVALNIDPSIVPQSSRSGAESLTRGISFGIQHFTTYPGEYPVGKPMIKNSAFMQATGEAKYTHDLMLPANGLHAAPVTSSNAAAPFSFQYRDKQTNKTKRGLEALIDFMKQSPMFPGFVDFVTFADVPGKELKHRLRNNRIGLGKDDPVFAPYVPDGTPGADEENKLFSNNTVTYAGALIGLVVADNAGTAIFAAYFIQNNWITYGQLRYNQYNYEKQKVKVAYSLDEAMALPDKKKAVFRQNPGTTELDPPPLNHIPGIERPGGDIKWLNDPKTRPMPGTTEISGTQRCGGQAHFYLETQSALVIPHENNRLTIYVSSQNPAGNQFFAARILDIDANHVEVVVNRIGGGFGGKQTRSAFTSSAAAVAAWKHNRPVKIELFRNTDTDMVGKRHPFLGQYRLAYEKKKSPKGWKIKGWSTVFNSDGGNTYDMSFPVMDLAQLHADNVYYCPTYRTEGNVYRTNRASNTAFRSFGTIQSILIQENAVEHMAHQLSKDQGKPVLPEDIREQNFYPHVTLKNYKKVPTTPYGQQLLYCNIKEIWDDLRKSSEFDARAKAVKEFNGQNRWKKRGISMIPLKYGISYTGPRGTLNQGYALVNVYQSDGTVLVLCGGVEMGQGLNTKMAQVAAQTLGIPIEKIRVGSTDSAAVPNATATAASTGSDLNGGAVAAACKKLRQRLEQFCLDLEQYKPHDAVEDWRVDWSGKWGTVIARAYTNRINLSAQAHYKTTHYSPVAYDQHPLKAFEYRGHPFFYFTYSAAVSEIELDVLTGQFNILRSDILFDAGKSLNPCLDVGQIEGAFVQGIGYVTTENLEYTGFGVLLNNRTWNYKPPFSKNIPVDFRVRLRKAGEQTVKDGIKLDNTAVKSSKGIGEPPFVLASTVFFAIKHAVMDARKDRGDDSWIEMDAPATVMQIIKSIGLKPDEMKL